MLTFAGGILGVLMMVPLRRALIVKEHGVLPYPGRHRVRRRAGRRRARRQARRDGLQRARRSARCGKSLSWIFNLFRTEIGYSTPRTSQFPERDAERRHLARVPGRRLRHRTAHRGDDVRRRRAVVAGAAAAAVDSRRVHHRCRFRRFIPNFANNPATGLPFLISEMSPGQLWSAYIRYIGAGAVLAAGLITLARTHSDHRLVGARELEGLRRGGRAGGRRSHRTRHPDDGRARRLAAAGPLPRRRAGHADAGQRPRRGPRS